VREAPTNRAAGNHAERPSQETFEEAVTCCSRPQSARKLGVDAESARGRERT